jgi:fermentation-respiration switch protein FrsA (DUF1100 family)
VAVRAAWLLLAFLVAAPALAAAGHAAGAAAFLVEFLSDGRWRPLATLAPRPVVRSLRAGQGMPPLRADLYVRGAVAPHPGLVLVHGVAPAGKNDPRLRWVAALLARAGWAVAVPTVEGLTRLRLRPEDAGTVVAAAEALARAGHPPVAIIGVSVGAGPALLAAAHPALERLAAVLSLGGYASAPELLRHALTGAYRFGAVQGQRTPDEGAIAAFVAANPDLLGEEAQRLVRNRDPEAVDALIDALPAPTQELLAALSPAEWIGRVRAPLFLVHGRDDPAVPFTESLRLAKAARAAGRPAALAVVGGVEHVEADTEAGRRMTASDLWRLWAVFYAFWVTSAAGTP